MLFEAQLKSDGTFQRAIHLLSKLIPSGLQGRLQCDSDRIKLRVMDKTQVVAVDVSLDPQRAFRTYRCDEPTCLPFDSIGLSRALKHNEIHEPNHAVRLASCWESGTQAETLGVYVEGKERVSACEVSLTDDHVTVTIPPVAYPCTVTMPTSTLSDILRHFDHLLADSCTVRVTSDSVCFTASCSNPMRRRCTKLYRQTPSINIAITRPIEEFNYLFSCLRHLVHAETYAETVIMSLLDVDYPIRCTFPFVDSSPAGHVSYHLAPRTWQHGSGPAVTLPMEIGSAGSVHEAHMEDCSMFVALMVHVSEYGLPVRGGSLHFANDKLEIEFVDARNVSLTRVCLFSEAFDFFRSERSLTLGVDLEHINRILQHAGNEDTLTLSADDSGSLHLRMESSSRQEATIAELNEKGAMRYKIPAETYTYVLSMPVTLYERIIKSLNGNICAMSITKEGVMFSTVSESLSILDRKDNQVCFDVKEAIRMEFSLTRMKLFQVSRLGLSISISLAQNLPMKFACSVFGTNGTLTILHHM